MLTPQDVRSVQFEKNLRGYRTEDVDRFLDKVEEQLQQNDAQAEQLRKQIADLTAENQKLKGELQSFEADGDMLKSALINAQRMGENVIREANQKAEEIIHRANLRGDDIIRDANELLQKASDRADEIENEANEKRLAEEREYDRVRLEVTRFKADVLNLYRSHVESLSRLPEFQKDAKEAEKDAPVQDAEPVQEAAAEQPAAQPELCVVHAGPAPADAAGKIVDFAEGKRMAQGQAAAPPGAAETQDGALLACILDMGELLLTSGAEVMRVEDTLTRLCMVYGFAQADVFTITSSIVLTVRTPEGRALTQTRRIRARDTDLGRVERVNALSRRLCAGPLPPEKFRQAVEEVRNAPAYPDAAQCAMYAVISAAFSAFFGGTLRDAATAAVSGMLLFGALRFCQRLRLNGILQSMLASALAALAVMLMVGFGLGQNPDKIIIGNIMLLIPGIALTTSLRDMINGDTISGLLGLSEAVLKALAIAIGFAAVLMRMGG